MRINAGALIGFLYVVFLVLVLMVSNSEGSIVEGSVDAFLSGASVIENIKATPKPKAAVKKTEKKNTKTEDKDQSNDQPSEDIDRSQNDNSSDGDQTAIASPYDHAVLTQGSHGASYGQAAIDIAAGKNAIIKSPINGRVSALYVDQYGNTILVIENDVYRVMMYHGNYSVEEGQHVSIGDEVGREWNNGYTVDWNGNLCAGRDCGYHTHLNIFDKRTGENANPLDLITIK
jgi:murein DD-endopeptidase MepM/ murein hydrolase activator NlpD